MLEDICYPNSSLSGALGFIASDTKLNAHYLVSSGHANWIPPADHPTKGTLLKLEGVFSTPPSYIVAKIREKPELIGYTSWAQLSDSVDVSVAAVVPEFVPKMKFNHVLWNLFVLSQPSQPLKFISDIQLKESLDKSVAILIDGNRIEATLIGVRVDSKRYHPWRDFPQYTYKITNIFVIRTKEPLNAAGKSGAPIVTASNEILGLLIAQDQNGDIYCSPFSSVAAVLPAATGVDTADLMVRF